jgi:hypothetical protein
MGFKQIEDDCDGLLWYCTWSDWRVPIKQIIENRKRWLGVLFCYGIHVFFLFMMVEKVEWSKIITQTELIIERTLMSPRGGVNRRDDQIKLYLPQTLELTVLHRSDRWWWQVRPVKHWSSQVIPVRPVRLTGQTGVAQRTCRNNFKHLLASSTNQT